MASAEENKLAFVMMALKHAEWKVDWSAVATESGITLAGNAQRKFRDIAKAAGYTLANGKIVDSDGTTAVAKATPAKRKSSTKPGKATATSGEADQEAMKREASEDSVSESPTKKAKTRKTPAKKSKAINGETDKAATNGSPTKTKNDRLAGATAGEGAQNEIKQDVEGEDGA